MAESHAVELRIPGGDAVESDAIEVAVMKVRTKLTAEVSRIFRRPARVQVSSIKRSHHGYVVKQRAPGR